jgi:Flp pilus assembly pilin Flp
MSLLCLRAWLFAVDRICGSRDQRGQTTAEYALVIIGVAAIASLLIAWATKSHAVTKLFDSVIDKITP